MLRYRGDGDAGIADSESMPRAPVVSARASRRPHALFAAIGLPHILLLALCLRLTAMTVATAVHPDEVLQYLETAHRLVFGPGVVTWEWRAGLRGWLLPLLVSAPMALGGAIAPASGLYLAVVAVTMIGVSLTTVWVAWRLGLRLSRLHAQVAGLIAATWCEFIYLAPHVLSETASLALILPAALLLVERERWSDTRLALAAGLLGSAVAIRFQNGPAVATLAIAACGRDWRTSWRPLMIGAAVGLLPSALADAAMGEVPFAWVIENVRLNLVEHRAAGFSSSGPLGYVFEIWPRLALWSVPLVLLARIGARRYPALAWMAAVHFGAHCLIAHKEYRFVLLSTALVVLLAAIGTVDWVRAIARAEGAAPARDRLRFLLIVWILASLSLAGGGYRSQWTKFRPELDLYARLRADPGLCGVALYRHDYSVTGGYAYLHRPVPLYDFADDDGGTAAYDAAASSRSFTVVMTTPDHAAELPASFVRDTCERAASGTVCLYRRPGPCAGDAPHYRINTVLARTGA